MLGLGLDSSVIIRCHIFLAGVDVFQYLILQVVRVVANMAIDQSVAVNITNNTDFVDIIIKLLRMYFTVFHFLW